MIRLSRLRGRDSILANFLLNGIVNLYTHEQKLVNLGKITMGDNELGFTDPVAKE